MDPIKQAIDAAGGPSKVSQALKVSAQAVCFWRAGGRKFPPDHAAQLEALGNYAVRRWHMFPATWHRIWPELIGTPGAPPTPTLATPGGAAAHEQPAPSNPSSAPPADPAPRAYAPHLCAPQCATGECAAQRKCLGLQSDQARRNAPVPLHPKAAT